MSVRFHYLFILRQKLPLFYFFLILSRLLPVVILTTTIFTRVFFITIWNYTSWAASCYQRSFGLLNEGKNLRVKLLLLGNFQLHCLVLLGVLILHVLIERAFRSVRLRAVLYVAHIVALDFTCSPPMSFLIFSSNVERHPESLFMGLPIVLHSKSRHIWLVFER